MCLDGSEVHKQVGGFGLTMEKRCPKICLLSTSVGQKQSEAK